MALILGGVALGSGAVRFAAARAGRRALAVNVTLRRAEPGDVDFLLELMTHEDVDPFMAVVRPRDREGVLGRDRALAGRAGGVRSLRDRGRRRSRRD